MKFTSILLTFLFIYDLCAFAQSKEASGFTITGNIIGLPDKSEFYLIKSVNQQADTMSVVYSNNSSFSFSGPPINGAEFHWIKIKGYEKYLTIFLDNSNVDVTGSLNNWPYVEITGSPSNDDYLSAEKILDSSQNRNETARKYISSHPYSLYSAILIKQDESWTSDEKYKQYLQLDKNVQQSKYGQQLIDLIQLERKQELIQVGNLLPNVTSKSITGKTVSILTVAAEGEVTLVDFWASWCAPCRSEIPNLKKVYKEFHSRGFNILSISLDNNKQAWLKASKEEDMPWPQVSELAGRTETSAQLLAINGIPASILINKKGEILALDLPGSKIISNEGSLRGQNLYKKIEELVRKQ